MRDVAGGRWKVLEMEIYGEGSCKMVLAVHMTPCGMGRDCRSGGFG